MKSSPHFGVHCAACQELVAVSLPAEGASGDPVTILRSLSPKDQQEIVAFWQKHEAHGCAPAVMDVQPREKA